MIAARHNTGWEIGTSGTSFKYVFLQVLHIFSPFQVRLMLLYSQCVRIYVLSLTGCTCEGSMTYQLFLRCAARKFFQCGASDVTWSACTGSFNFLLSVLGSTAITCSGSIWFPLFFHDCSSLSERTTKLSPYEKAITFFKLQPARIQYVSYCNIQNTHQLRPQCHLHSCPTK